MWKQEKNKKIGTIILGSVIFLSIFIALVVLLQMMDVSAADPQGPDVLNVSSNETKGTVGAQMWNISGGYITSANLSATVQDTRWKAFIGQVTGLFTLDDASGSTIFDWELTSITGRVYATRNDSSITWANINCSNLSFLEDENYNMNHTNANDNITSTFNLSEGATHSTFYVGSKLIGANSCPTLNTYVDNATQDNRFEEMALDDGTSVVYATIMEEDQTGYNSQNFDFQMIVPENGAPSFAGATAYYIYIEIGN